MLSFAVLPLIKRAPRTVSLLLNFIAVFLAVFLLLGCYNSANESTFLVRYQIDKRSPFFRTIQASFGKDARTAGLEKVKVRAGYMGVCVDRIPANYNLHNSSLGTVCYPRKNLTATPLYTDLAVHMFNAGSNSSSALNILDLAQRTSVNVIHPYLLMGTIVLTILGFLTQVYCVVPGLPCKAAARAFMLTLAPVLVLVSGMSAVWTHIGVHAAVRLVPAASMGMASVYAGRKAGSMMWFAFAFVLVVCVVEWVGKIAETMGGNDKHEEQSNHPAAARPPYYNYYSDSSSYGTKA